VRTARIVLDPAFAVAEVDERVYGSFVEHMGRAVYGGIYEPGHPTADADGFRSDVIELVRELGVTIVRYPGGNFVSGYDWEDGVGPRDERPRAARPRLALARAQPRRHGRVRDVGAARGRRADAGRQPRDGRNRLCAARWSSTATLRAAACMPTAGGRTVMPSRTASAVWCLGNEMDGPWQIGHMTAAEYGRLANETGKAMRLVDPSIELVVCGSSNSSCRRSAAWEDTVSTSPGTWPTTCRCTPTTTARSTTVSTRTWPARSTSTA
jgi:alpha-N-arabinofuranosidase